jgi:hypothetical protein
MNWKWIGILACVSVVTSLLTVFGVIPQGAIGNIISIVMLLALSYVMAQTTTERFFRNGFTLGAVCGIVAVLMQMLFFDKLIENNADLAEKMSKMPANMNPVVMMAMFAPITIGLLGTAQGLFTLGMAAVMGKRSGRRTVPPSSPPSPV